MGVCGVDTGAMTTPDQSSSTAPVRRLVVALTIGSFSVAALMGIIALLSGGAFGEREGQVLLTTLVVGVTSVAMLCYLATSGTRFQAVGAVGGVVVLLPAAQALMLIWNSDAWDAEIFFKLFGIGATVAATLAQLALLLGVAGDRRRLAPVLWATVAMAIGVAGVVCSMIVTESGGDDVARLLGVMAILDVLGTVVTLALAIFGNRRPDEPGAAIRIPVRLEAPLAAACAESGRSRDDVVADALEAWLARTV